MTCLKCNNEKNFIVFKGDVLHVKNGETVRIDSDQTRAMCNECFSCEVVVNKIDIYFEEVA